MRQLVFCCIALLSWHVSTAQAPCDLVLTGRVIDEHDGTELSYANIVVEGTNQGVTSDGNGNYTLSNLCPGTLTLVCTHIGCEPVRTTIELTRSTTLDFYPEHHSELLEMFTVSSDSDTLQIQSIVTMQPNDLLIRANLGQYVADLPGVSTLSTGNSIAKPMVRGMHSNRLLILNNGVRQEGQQWGNEHAPEIDPSIAGEVQVIKGASSVRYGPEAMGGVILVKPKPLPKQFGIGASVNLSGQSNGQGGAGALMLEGRHERVRNLRWRVQGSGRKLGDVASPDYTLTNTGVEELNFSAQGQWSNAVRGAEVFYSQFNSNLGILASSHIGNLTDLERAFASETPLQVDPFGYAIDRPYQNVLHELTKASAWQKIHGGGELRVIYARQYNRRQEYDKHRSSGDAPSLQFEIVTHSLDVALNNLRRGRHQINAGLAGLMQANTFEGRFFIPNFRKWTSGIYLIDRWEHPSGWVIEGGARLDYLLQRIYLRENDVVRTIDRSFVQPSVSLGAAKEVRPDLVWKINLATAWRPPNVSEWFSNGLHHGVASFEIGDTSLVAETSFNASTSLSWNAGSFSFMVEPYANYVRDFIYLAPRFPATLTIRGAFPTFAYAQTDALLYGTDAFLTWDATPFIRAISRTSILRARDLANDDWIPQMPADQSRLSIRIHQKKDRNRYWIEPSLQWTNKQWRIPSVGDYVPPPEAYWLAGIGAGYEHRGSRVSSSIQFEIQNLFNTRYRSYLNRYRYFSDEMGRNMVLRLTHQF